MGLAALRHHRRYPVMRGAWLRSEGALGGIGGQALIAAMCALATAVLGALLGSVSLGDIVLAAMLGAAFGLLLVRGVAVAVELGRYHRRRYRVRDWKALPGRVIGGEIVFELACTAPRPGLEPVAALGAMEVEITDSTGASVRVLSRSLDRLGSRVQARCPLPPCPGSYEVRWYASTPGEKLYEVTRAKFPRLTRPGESAA